MNSILFSQRTIFRKKCRLRKARRFLLLRRFLIYRRAAGSRHDTANRALYLEGTRVVVAAKRTADTRGNHVQLVSETAKAWLPCSLMGKEWWICIDFRTTV